MAQLFSPFVFEVIGGPTGIEINNMGFRKMDGLLYAVQLNDYGNDQIIQVDRNADIFGLGRPPGLPSGVRFDAGDVSPDGATMYITTNYHPLYKLDLTSVPVLPAVTSVPITGSTGNVHDWAAHETNGTVLLYGGDHTHGQLAVLNPATGIRTDLGVAGMPGVPGLPRGVAYGGAWFDSFGQLFLFRNNGEIYQIDLAGPQIVAYQTGPSSSRNDGAICPLKFEEASARCAVLWVLCKLIGGTHLTTSNNCICGAAL